MDLRTLKYFIATVEEGSISGAALRCHIAQPSITLAISKLEEELACKLFERHRKGCSATSEGERMYKMACGLIAHADSIKYEFLQREPLEKITLVVDKNIRVTVLQSFLKASKASSSNIQFELVSENTSQQAHTVDIRLSSKSNVTHGDTFVPLSSETYALFIPKDHVLAYKNDIALMDLNKQGFIYRIHCENQCLFSDTVEALGLTLINVANVESEEWAMALVTSGLGMTIAPVPSDFEDERFIVRSISECFGFDAPTREVGLIIPHDKFARLSKLIPNLATAGAVE